MPVITMKTNEGGIIAYEWWCPTCGTYHYGSDCPRDDLTAKPEPNVMIFIGNVRYDLCPCCGQLVKRRGKNA